METEEDVPYVEQEMSWQERACWAFVTGFCLGVLFLTP